MFRVLKFMEKQLGLQNCPLYCGCLLLSSVCLEGFHCICIPFLEMEGILHVRVHSIECAWSIRTQ